MEKINSSLQDIKNIIEKDKLFIANYDLLSNKGLLSDGRLFSFNETDSLTVSTLRNFLQEYEKPIMISSIKDAVIQAIQDYKKLENEKIYDIIEKIIQTDEEMLNLESLSLVNDKSGIQYLAKNFFLQTTNAYKDVQSNLLNKNFYMEFLEPEQETKKMRMRTILKDLGILSKEQFDKQDFSVSIISCDLDNIKALNDKINHLAGDRAIETFATALLQIQQRTLPMRIGGDEFVLICKNEDASDIVKSIESEEFILNLQNTLKKHIRIQDIPVLENYPFKATCAEARFSLNDIIDLKASFQAALVDADDRIHEKKNQRNPDNIYRKLKG